jgi:hypothetical protein
MLFGVIAMLLFTRLDLDSSYAPDVLAPLMVLGLAMGTIMPASMQTATLGVDRQFAGVASATVNTSQQIGGSIGTALLNTIAANVATDYIAAHQPPTELVVAQAAVDSYAAAYWWDAAFFAAGGIIAALLFRRRGHGVSLTSGHAAADAEPVVAH